MVVETRRGRATSATLASCSHFFSPSPPLFFSLQAATTEIIAFKFSASFVALFFFSILSPAMERSTLWACRGAQGASRGVVLRPGAGRRSCVVDSISSLRSSLIVVAGQRRRLNHQQQQPRIPVARAAPSTPPSSGSAGDEADVLKLHEELLAQVRNSQTLFEGVEFLGSLDWKTSENRLATKDEKTSTTSFFFFLLISSPLFPSSFFGQKKTNLPPTPDRAAQEPPARAHGGPPRGGRRERLVRPHGREGAGARRLFSAEKGRRRRPGKGSSASASARSSRSACSPSNEEGSTSTSASS